MIKIMNRPIAKTIYGELQGVYEKDSDDNCYVAFKGIPYAKPPVGTLRFQVSLVYLI